jgi:hypothetical protein
MKKSIELFCDKLSTKLNKIVTYKYEQLILNIKGGENYRIFVNNEKTKLIINESDYTTNIAEQKELIDICVEYCVKF